MNFENRTMISGFNTELVYEKQGRSSSLISTSASSWDVLCQQQIEYLVTSETHTLYISMENMMLITHWGKDYSSAAANMINRSVVFTKIFLVSLNSVSSRFDIVSVTCSPWSLYNEELPCLYMSSTAIMRDTACSTASCDCLITSTAPENKHLPSCGTSKSIQITTTYYFNNFK